MHTKGTYFTLLNHILSLESIYNGSQGCLNQKSYSSVLRDTFHSDSQAVFANVLVRLRQVMLLLADLLICEVHTIFHQGIPAEY